MMVDDRDEDEMMLSIWEEWSVWMDIQIKFWSIEMSGWSWKMVTIKMNSVKGWRGRWMIKDEREMKEAKEEPRWRAE